MLQARARKDEMNIKCPNCQRPNAPEANKCIYCGSEIPTANLAPPQEQPTETRETRLEKEFPGETLQRLFLILSPHSPEPSQSAIEGLARLMGWDTYSARLRLKNPAPGILKAFDQIPEAQNFCQQLINLGIDAYLMKESGLKQVGEKQIALSAELKEEQIIFQFENQSPKDLSFKDCFLLVRGRVRLEGELGKKLGKSQIPDLQPERDKLLDRLIQRRRKKKIARLEIGSLIRAEATEVELFDLYSQPDHQAIQVIESLFDFSSIFGAEFQARLLGMAKLIDLLKSKCPNLIRNENFNQVGYTYREKQVERKTIWLPRNSKARSREKLHNPYELFREYSGIIYLHYLRKSRQK